MVSAWIMVVGTFCNPIDELSLVGKMEDPWIGDGGDGGMGRLQLVLGIPVAVMSMVLEAAAFWEA